MAKQNERIFSVKIALDAIVEAISDLKTSTAGAFAAYKLKTDKLSPETYSIAYITGKKNEARAEAVVALESADIMFRNELLSAAKDLRAYIGAIVTRPIPNEFIVNVRAYQDFGLEITPLEIRAFAAAAGDCYPALRVLCQVAGKAGYSVKIPQISELEQDVISIENAAILPTLYVPEDYSSLAGDLFPKVNGLISDDLLSSLKENKEPGRVTGFDALLRRQQMDRFETLLGEIRERWSLPCIVAEETKTHNGEDSSEHNGKKKSSDERSVEKDKAFDSFAENLQITNDKTPGITAIKAAAEAEKRAAEAISHYV